MNTIMAHCIFCSRNKIFKNRSTHTKMQVDLTQFIYIQMNTQSHA